MQIRETLKLFSASLSLSLHLFPLPLISFYFGSSDCDQSRDKRLMILLFSTPLVWITSCGWSVCGGVAVCPLAFIIIPLFFKAMHFSAFHLMSHTLWRCSFYFYRFFFYLFSQSLSIFSFGKDRESGIWTGEVISKIGECSNSKSTLNFLLLRWGKF